MLRCIRMAGLTGRVAACQDNANHRNGLFVKGRIPAHAKCRNPASSKMGSNQTSEVFSLNSNIAVQSGFRHRGFFLVGFMHAPNHPDRLNCRD